MLASAAWRVREANLVALAVDRPEIGGLHLARIRPTGLDRHFVHRLDTAGTYRIELCIVDRFEQRHARLHQLGQPRPADLDPGIIESAVLAVQRQVVVEFVDHHANDEADVGSAALDHADRGRRARERLRVFPLDQGAHVLEHDIAAGTLRQAVRDFLANHFVLIGLEQFHVRVGDGNHFHRHTLLIEEQTRFVGANRLGLALALVAGHHRFLSRQRRLGNGVETHAKNTLNTFWIRMALLAFLAEDLTLKPGHLASQIDVLALQFADQSHVLSDPFGLRQNLQGFQTLICQYPAIPAIRFRP
ncbi:hypothetical protein BSU04_45280 [Caballeronia sordidicola]|uniref:Uncharacterized protein n=1 Tax=Caballeronia sordidicola TaxID=196367 RepID=A0A226WKQ6_CABSO|nr:hypothetical protein BSU04_45280 [Caballeronia sordidicola]